MDVEDTGDGYAKVEDWPVIDDAPTFGSVDDTLDDEPNLDTGDAETIDDTGDIGFDEAMDDDPTEL